VTAFRNINPENQVLYSPDEWKQPWTPTNRLKTLNPESQVRYGPGEWKLLGLSTCHKEGEMVGTIKLVTEQQIPEIMSAKDAGELDGLKANGAIDVWGIGELMLHTLTGKPLFKSRKEAMAALVKAHKVR
jgi:hypothetical protein